MSEEVIERCSPEIDALSTPILDFDNKLMKSIKKFCKLLEDLSKGNQFYKDAAL